MRAITIPKNGPPSVLEVREYPDPTPKEGEIRISVRAAGLNFAEISARQGLYRDAPPLPSVVGYEVSGVVDQVGPGAARFKEGDRVLAMTRFGGHSSMVVVPEALVFPMPRTMSFAEGAALLVNYLTAHHMLFYIGTVHPRTSVLLHAAAGGVGTAVLQLLRPIPELTIYGTASRGKHEYLRKLGCTSPIDYREEDYAAVVREKTGGRGVELILDPMGGANWKRSWDLLCPAGRMVCFGFSAGIDGEKLSYLRVLTQVMRLPFISPIRSMQENKSLQGVNMGHLWDEIAVLEPQVRRLITLYEEGVIKPHIHAELPFDRAAEAHELLEGRRNMGKVVLVP